MKKKDAQIANKVASVLRPKFVTTTLPGHFEQWQIILGFNKIKTVKGYIVRKTISMETWKSSDLRLSGYANHPELKKNEFIEIPCPVNHLMSRKETKRIITTQGEDGLKQVLNQTWKLQNSKKVG